MVSAEYRVVASASAFVPGSENGLRRKDSRGRSGGNEAMRLWQVYLTSVIRQAYSNREPWAHYSDATSCYLR